MFSFAGFNFDELTPVALFANYMTLSKEYETKFDAMMDLPIGIPLKTVEPRVRAAREELGAAWRAYEQFSLAMSGQIYKLL